MFLLLSLISGLIETGTVIFALRHFGPETALLAAILYQIGNLVPFPLRLSKLTVFILAFASGTLMVIGVFFPIAVIFAIPCMSASLQSIRGEFKKHSPKMQKRIFRTIGFLLGFIFTPVIGIISATIIVIYSLISNAYSSKTIVTLPKFNKLHLVMIFHQMHYFVYCYIVMIVAYQYGGALFAAGLFFAGWITYVIAPILYRNSDNYKKIFLFGHLLLVVLLVSMFFIQSLPAMAFLWIMTGFGGTTEFCIGRLAKKYDLFNEVNHNCAENYGHILGVLVCLFAFVLTNSLYLPLLLSAMFASCAMVTMILFLKKVSL